jgi:replicative DNA helicase
MHTGLPVDVEAERMALGLVFSEEDSFPRLSAVLSADDFSNARHRRIFDAMADLYEAGKSIDFPSVAGRLMDRKQLSEVGGLEYLTSLHDPMSMIVFDFEQVCRRVKDKATLRRAAATLSKLLDECLMNGDSREVLDRAETAIRELSSENVRDRRLKDAGEIIREHGGLDAFLANTIAVADTPFPRLNTILGGGFREEELILLAARPSVGKSALATQIAEHNGKNGVGVAVFSLEMSNQELLIRMSCSRSGVDANAVRLSNQGRDYLSAEQRKRLGLAMGQIAGMPIYFDDTASCTVAAIHAAVRRLMASHPLGLVIVDYLQLMHAPGKHATRNDAVSTISRGLKLAAKELHLPFLVLSQVTRASAKAGEEIQLHDLRDSGSLEQDANTVIALNLREDDGNPDVRRVKAVVLKQRNGPVAPVDLLFKRSITRFAEETPEVQ